MPGCHGNKPAPTFHHFRSLDILFQTFRWSSAFAKSHLPRLFLATLHLGGTFGVVLLNALKALWSLWILHAVLCASGRYETESQRGGEQNADHENTPIDQWLIVS